MDKNLAVCVWGGGGAAAAAAGLGVLCCPQPASRAQTCVLQREGQSRAVADAGTKGRRGTA